MASLECRFDVAGDDTKRSKLGEPASKQMKHLGSSVGLRRPLGDFLLFSVLGSKFECAENNIAVLGECQLRQWAVGDGRRETAKLSPELRSEVRCQDSRRLSLNCSSAVASRPKILLKRSRVIGLPGPSGGRGSSHQVAKAFSISSSVISGRTDLSPFVNSALAAVSNSESSTLSLAVIIT